MGILHVVLIDPILQPFIYAFFLGLIRCSASSIGSERQTFSMSSRDLNVPGSSPGRSWAFYFFYFLFFEVEISMYAGRKSRK